MRIRARVENGGGENRVTLQTGESQHSIEIPAKASGYGSSANGGELLFLALAACYVNDIYREAALKGIVVERVEVEVEGDFPTVGGPAENVVYRARVAARASAAEIRALARYTDTVAEIHNTLRAATEVRLAGVEAEESGVN